MSLSLSFSYSLPLSVILSLTLFISPSHSLSLSPSLSLILVPIFVFLKIPRIDINAPSNAIELDPNVSALYGEGVADSGDECEDGSGADEEVSCYDNNI